mmetsp:Transcript_30882/g.89687  ORF Transcript_30882/g.89687 Transcript_30882/m.89687 type:complete len:307 (+) Transcript_30882:391-1311(+)
MQCTAKARKWWRKRRSSSGSRFPAWAASSSSLLAGAAGSPALSSSSVLLFFLEDLWIQVSTTCNARSTSRPLRTVSLFTSAAPTSASFPGSSLEPPRAALLPNSTRLVAKTWTSLAMVAAAAAGREWLQCSCCNVSSTRCPRSKRVFWVLRSSRTAPAARPCPTDCSPREPLSLLGPLAFPESSSACCCPAWAVLVMCARRLYRKLGIVEAEAKKAGDSPRGEYDPVPPFRKLEGSPRLLARLLASSADERCSASVTAWRAVSLATFLRCSAAAYSFPKFAPMMVMGNARTSNPAIMVILATSLPV